MRTISYTVVLVASMVLLLLLPRHAPASAAPPQQLTHEDAEFLFVGPPTVSLDTYQSVYCQPRYGGPSAACAHTPQMYQMLVAAGIDPVIEMAFAAKETEFGNTGPGREPQRNIHNISCNDWDLGTCEGPHHYRFATYPTYLHGIHAWITLMLNRGTYVDAGNMTFRQIIPIYAPPFENDTELYINQVEGMVRTWRGWDATQGFSTWRDDIVEPAPTVSDNPLVQNDPRFGTPLPPVGDLDLLDIGAIPAYEPVDIAELVEPPTPLPPDPDLPTGATMAVDNEDYGFSANQGTWEYTRCGLNGDHVATTSTSTMSESDSRASWSPIALAPGVYEVRAYIPDCGEGEMTTSARYTITHDNGTDTVTIDQQAHAGAWVSLGSYFFGARLNPVIQLNNQTDDDGRMVRVDAMVWIRGEDTTPPQVSIERLIQMENGINVQWQGADAQSGIARYEVQVRRLPDGRWRPWLYATTRTQAVRLAPPGAALEFRVRALDRSGNQGEWSPVLGTAQAEQIFGIGTEPAAEADTPPPLSLLDARSGIERETSTVTNGGNLRTAPRLAPETVIVQVCPGDSVVVLDEERVGAARWLHIRVVALAEHCVENHAVVGTEGWLSDTLLEQP